MIKRKLTATIILLLVILSLSGCGNTQMELELNEDNSGTYGITLGLDNETIEKYDITAKELLSELIEDNSILQTENTSYTVGDTEYKGIRAYFEFESIEDMQNKLNGVFGTVINEETGHKVPKYNIASGIKTEEESIFSKTISISIPVENISGQREEVQTLPDIGVDITFKMSLPGEVINTNSDNNSLEWKIDTSLETIEATYIIDKDILGIKVRHLVSLMVAGLVVLVIILFASKRIDNK